MPHVIVKLATGRTDEQKRRIADEITKVIMATAHVDESAVSVSIEDVPLADWTDRVYHPDIAAKPDTLVKAPGYTA